MKESEEKRNSLCAKIQKPNNTLCKELEVHFNDLKQQREKDRMDFENQLKKLNKELEIVAKENSSLKSYIDELVDENTKLKLDIKNFPLEIKESKKTNQSTDESLKNQYLEAIQRFQEDQNKIKHLEENVEDLINGKTLAKGEQCNLRYQISDYKNKLNEQNEVIKALKNEINNLNVTLKENNDLINELRLNPSLHDYEELEKILLSQEQALKISEETVKNLGEQVEELKCKIEQLKEEIMKLTKELAIETEKNVQRNIEKELNDTQKALDKLRENRSEECKYRGINKVYFSIALWDFIFSLFQ